MTVSKCCMDTVPLICSVEICTSTFLAIFICCVLLAQTPLAVPITLGLI